MTNLFQLVICLSVICTCDRLWFLAEKNCCLKSYFDFVYVVESKVDLDLEDDELRCDGGKLSS